MDEWKGDELSLTVLCFEVLVLHLGRWVGRLPARGYGVELSIRICPLLLFLFRGFSLWGVGRVQCRPSD